MDVALWLIAAAVLTMGVFAILKSAVKYGLILIVIALLLGPAGTQLFGS